ncbi:MAG: hypothetical protein ABIV48_03110 [Pyrinomonadaceae bacterium]
MKIQEMKSRVSHLIKKAEPSGRDNVLEMRSLSIAEPDQEIPAEPSCELDDPRWSVVSFERRLGGHLTYHEADVLRSELDSKNVSGLCIITDEAATRIKT